MPWHPRNKYCWDFWFAWHEQTLQVFYLQASRLACAYNPERRHNLASVGHAVLTDCGWKEINPDKPALSSRDGDFWDNVAIWTGSIIEKGDRCYMFYIAYLRGCLKSVKHRSIPLAPKNKSSSLHSPLSKGGWGGKGGTKLFKVPLLKGDLGGSSTIRCSKSDFSDIL